MTIALQPAAVANHTGTASTPPATRPLNNAKNRSDQRVTVTITVDLEVAPGSTLATTLAGHLHSQAQQVASTYGSTARVSITGQPSPAPTFTRALGQASARIPPRTAGPGPVPLRPRKSGVVSPAAPARRDAEAARLRLLNATAVSPSSPATAITSRGNVPFAPSVQAARTLTAGLVVDLFGRRVRIDGEDVDLTHREYELLAYLARHARQVINRAELMENVWHDPEGATCERTVDVHIRRVRNKLGRYRKLITTVRGAGYRLELGSDVTILGLQGR